MCPLCVIFRSNESSNKWFCLVVAGFNILLDIWVLILPIKALKDIKIPTRDKIVLFIIFGFGVLACISRLVHLYMLLFQALLDSDWLIILYVAWSGYIQFESLQRPMTSSMTTSQSIFGR